MDIEDIRYGFHRAKVVDNVDEQKMGRVLVWIPDVMTFIPDTNGIWARPANNPIGGRNAEDGNDYIGTSYIPRNNSWVWIFFESGNVNRPYYFAACDLENAKSLPETQIGNEYYHKYVIFKSKDGRTVIVSDDPDDARVEITGKKRKLQSPPAGDTGSVYTIDENQSTILFDERDGKEKILIRTYKGDFLHIDIDEQELHAQFENDIHIKSNNGSIFITAQNGLHLKANLEALNIQAGADNVNIKAGGKIQEQSGGDHSTKSGGNVTESATGAISSLAGSQVSHDPIVNDAGGASGPASDAGDATAASPQGDRNT
jgi:hypothetical protein